MTKTETTEIQIGHGIEPSLRIVAERAPRANYVWSTLSAFFCVVFGVALILNTHPVGDGSWFWYARLWRAGHRLYADMHCPLQPLFVLLTAASQQLLGLSWLASKALAFAQLVLYCTGIALIARRIPWKDRDRAFAISAVFGLSIMAIYARFDDYHVTCHILGVYSVYLFLRFSNNITTPVVILLGLLSGLSMSDRPNDGAALLASSALCLFFYVRRRRIGALLTFFASAFGTFLVLILTTRDTLRDWFANAVTGVASIKGTPDRMLLAPFKFPLSLMKRLVLDLNQDLLMIYVGCSAFLLWYVFSAARSEDRWRGKRLWAFIAVAAGLPLATLPISASRDMSYGQLVAVITSITVLAVYAFTALVCYRTLVDMFQHRRQPDNPAHLLLLFPAMQVMAGAVTSGKSILESYHAIALFLLILPIVFPRLIPSGAIRYTFVGLLAITTVGAFTAKVLHPYYWHHFIDKPLFLERTWFQHPKFGPIYVDKRQLRLAQNFCTEIQKGSGPKELLEITNPYINWFCDIEPWHDYVQTWYDTISEQRVHELMRELETAPPRWLVYQRSVDSMEAHEYVFNGGKPIPHRALDQLIMTSIKDQKWGIEDWRKNRESDWMLIDTPLDQ